MQNVLQLDDAVLLTDGIGIIMYVGNVRHERGQWLGLKLVDGLQGNCDGMKGAERYFKCEPNQGMFIRTSQIVRKLSPEELVQKIIQLREGPPAPPPSS